MIVIHYPKIPLTKRLGDGPGNFSLGCKYFCSVFFTKHLHLLLARKGHTASFHGICLYRAFVCFSLVGLQFCANMFTYRNAYNID